MSGIGGEIGGKIGNKQNPFFTSPGGVTPQEASLAQYDYGQNLLEGLAEFQGQGEGGGPIMSTMATQTAGGANVGKALDLAKASDINQTAAFGASEVANNIQATNQNNALTQISQLDKIASAAAPSSDATTGAQAGFANPVPGSGP